MKVSVCMASFNRDPVVLRKVLESIYRQSPPFERDVIVVDDGSSFGAPEVCREFPVIYHRIERLAKARNPSVARNVAYRLASGDVIIAQSDDVVHQGNAIEKLANLLVDNLGSFVIATVFNCDNGVLKDVYTGEWGGQRRHVPLFFLGALWKSDLYAVGGNDEEFDSGHGNGGWEDKWFAKCLIEGRHLTPFYAGSVFGCHISHERQSERAAKHSNMNLYHEKIGQAQSTGVWCSACGPWKVYDGATTLSAVSR
jgi:glycosyltransferase involved in cell wall biosynthesis